jgi:hypothetical protein
VLQKVCSRACEALAAIGLTEHTRDIVVEAATRSAVPEVRHAALDALCTTAANEDWQQFSAPALRSLVSVGLVDSDEAVRGSAARLVAQLLQAAELDAQSNENIMAAAVAQPRVNGLQSAAKLILLFEQLEALDDTGVLCAESESCTSKHARRDSKGSACFFQDTKGRCAHQYSLGSLQSQPRATRGDWFSGFSCVDIWLPECYLAYLPGEKG